MARFWFVSAPLFSHTDWGGFFKTAQALQTRGHDVLWLSEAPLEPTITQRGVAFRVIRKTGWLWPPPPPPDLSSIPPQEAVMLRYKRALDTWLSEDLVAEAVEALLDLEDEIGGPDAIVSDPFLSASAIAAELLDVPLIICGWPAQATLDANELFPVQRDLSSDSQRRIQQLCDRFGIDGRNFSRGSTPSIVSEALHISYFTPGWYGAEQTTILPQTQFVGGAPSRPVNPKPQWLTDIPLERGRLGWSRWARYSPATWASTVGRRRR